MIEWYELIVHDWIKSTDKDNTLFVIQLSDLIGCKQFFATMSSDKFKMGKNNHSHREVGCTPFYWLHFESLKCPLGNSP